MIKTYKDFLKLYEYHPGSEPPYVEISNEINRSLEMGGNPYVIKSILKELLNRFRGGNTASFHRRSDEYKYMSIINNAIEKSMDAGYPEDLIFDDLEKIYNEMK